MRLKSVLLASACVVALPALASAADLPLRSAPPAFVPPPPPVFTWTGFYLGVNAGYDFDHFSRFNTTAVAPATTAFVPVTRGVSDDGFTAGGQIGYNYQFGGFGAASAVIGLEADAAYTDIGRTAVVTSAPNAFGLTTVTRLHSSLDYLGTVRGRLGLAFDRVLVYGTGGFAYGQVDHNFNVFAPGGGGIAYAGGASSVETGYAVGGGVEWAVPTDSFLSSLNFLHSSAVTVKAEYLYYNLGDQNFTSNPTGPAFGGRYNVRTRTDGNIARVGLNYKF
jgi:outer membrane immunogenic protein